MERFVTLTTAGRFQLARPLHPKYVALVDVILPSEYYNIHESKLLLKAENGWNTKVFPGGNYKSLFEAGRTLQELLGTLYKVEVDNVRSRLMLQGSAGDRINLKLSPHLASVFKLPVSIRASAVSHLPVDLTIYCMYVTADFVSPQLFNDGSLKVLAVVNPKDVKITHPIFVELNKDIIDNIELSLVDPSGNVIQFLSGTPKFVLCFRNA